MFDRLSLPQPWLSLALFFIWQVLSDGVSGGSIAIGIVLAWLIPQITHGFWPERPSSVKVWLVPAYTLRVLKDIVVASCSVAWLILSPRSPRPTFVCYPLQLQHPQAIFILASTISLTPGTVSADISEDRQSLLIHALDAGGDQEVIDAIYNSYEKPLMEMFQ